MIRHLAFIALLGCCTATWAGAVQFKSAHAIVVDEDTGEVLLEKDASTAAPIASMTKLMTVMTVLDASQDGSELITIEEADMDHLKHTRSGVPVGASIPRSTLIELALIASDNHAAAALGRNFPGGLTAFRLALQDKAAALGLQHTTLDEPTGLSPSNHASATDMVRVLQATSQYPVISAITSQREHSVEVNGQPWDVRNTNSLVGQAGWTILSSKTGFTNEAGRCVTMRLQAAGRTVIVVLMGAMASSARALDALRVRRFLTGEPEPIAAPRELLRTARKKGGSRAVKVAAAAPL